jgi:hypothetical protein
MTPVIRISDATYAHLQRHAKPFEDSPESIIVKALAALDMMTGEPSPAVRAESNKRNDGPKLPQKEFRIPLLMTILEAGGSAPAKTVRSKMEPLMAAKLSEGDYESVSTGDPRWWNAICWERSDLVKEGLIRGDSDRGIWQISDNGNNLPSTLHRKREGTGEVIFQGTLADVARKYWAQSSFRHRYFVKVGDVVFQEETALNSVFLTKIDRLELSMRSFLCLKNASILYLGDLVQKSEAEMLRTPNFGRKSLNEIKDVLAAMGLHLGMDTPGWPPENVEVLASRFEDMREAEK